MLPAARHTSRFLGAVLLAALGNPAAAADPLSMRFEIYGFLNMQVLTLRTQVEEVGERYAVSAEYKTTGLAGLIVPQSTHAVASGRLGRGTAYPEVFRNDTRRNGVDRHSRVEYRQDGAVDGSSTPPPQTVVAPAVARGTVDNLTAYLRLERQLAATGTCDMTVPVFDGRHRYDLVFSNAGRQALKPENGQHFSGEVIGCRMSRHNRVVEESEKDEGARAGTVWYARLVSSDVVIPVRMRLETHIGAVDAYLAELHGRGVDLRLMP